MNAPFSQLTNSTLLLTVNNRLAQQLHQHYDQQQAASGSRVWATPKILPWSAWMQQQYESLLDQGYTERVLLNTTQLTLLWERVVEQSTQAEHLLRPNAAARSAQQAWQLVQEWQVDSESLRTEANEETQVFLAWREQFERLCVANHWITISESPKLLAEAASDGLLAIPKQLLLAGFDSFSPTQQALLDVLVAQGCQVDHWQSEPCHLVARRIELPDPEHEMRAAASWAKNWIEQRPQSRVAIVSPRLQAQRQTLQRICAEIIEPHSLLPGHAARAGSVQQRFNLSLGARLSELPLIAHLLITLRLSLRRPLESLQISTLLRSPFIAGHTSEWEARAQLDAELRQQGMPQIDLFHLLRQAQRFHIGHPAHCPLLVECLQALLLWLENLPKQDSPNAWSGHLLEVQKSMGWPGQGLDSHEYQQHAKLRDTISLFASLGNVEPSLTLRQFVQRFTSVCEQQVFQAQTQDAPIQVLGILEAAGLSFDAIWLLDMTDQSWPPPPSPNPLLPARLQRQLQMPHASAERELLFARHLTEQLLQASPELIASHALLDEQREQRPSPLTTQLPLVGLTTLGVEIDQSLFTQAAKAGQCEPLSQPAPLPPTVAPRGGSALLSDQSACPFRAVAKHRLQARPVAEYEASPGPTLLGSMVHDVLERVWRQIGSSSELHKLNHSNRRQLIEPLAQATLADLGRQRPDIFTPAFVELEQQRLVELVDAWLEIELQRELPFEVLHTEQRQAVDLHGLNLQLRADRVDRLADGRLVIIDYKTGERATAGAWADQRPTDLQVPLYCLQAEQAPAAALIARVNSRSTLFDGVAEEDNIVPGVAAFTNDRAPADWQQLLTHWRDALQHLAEEIQQGRAEIAPLDENTCRYCDLGPLCRIGSEQTSVIDDANE